MAVWHALPFLDGPGWFRRSYYLLICYIVFNDAMMHDEYRVKRYSPRP